MYVLLSFWRLLVLNLCSTRHSPHAHLGYCVFPEPSEELAGTKAILPS